MSPTDFVARGQALVDSGRHQDAVRVCRLGLLADPTAVEGRLVLASALQALRRYDEVLAEMRVALESDPDNARALALKGEALLRKGDARQARDILDRARRADPGNALVRALYKEAETAEASSSSFDPLASDNMTKHYPAHRGASTSGEPDSRGVTRPTGVLRNTATPPPQVLAVGDSSGTIELDPELEGVEMPDDLDDPPVEPPIAASADESDVMELASADLVEARGKGAMHERVPADADTAHYRRPQGDFDQGATEVAGPPRDFASAPPTIGTSPETPNAKPAGGLGQDAQRARRQARADMDLEELFPDPETGVSSLEVVGEAAPLAPVAPGGGPRSQTEDMQTIRAGLGLRDSDPGRRSRSAPRRHTGEDTEHVRARKRRQRDRARARKSDGRARARKSDGRPRTVDVAHTQAVRKAEPGSRLAGLAYVGLALVVLAVGVVAGFEIREIRLDRQIRAADTWGLLDRDGEPQTRIDTYASYVQARDAYAEIVEVRDDQRTRTALARAQAALAAEFGDGRAEAERLVATLGDDESLDALVARAYLAVAQAEPAAARRLARQITGRHPQSSMGPYLLGRAELLAENPDAAAEAFRQALRLGQHAAIKVGLGMAEAARGNYPEAQSAFDRALDMVPGHPAAIIGRARVSSRRTDLLEDTEQPEKSLHDLIDEGKRPLEQQQLGVSREQMGWAALALAKVKLARGDAEAARDAVLQAQGLRPDDDWEFAEALADALLRVGQVEAAKREAERAVERWPQRVEARVLLAEVALLHADGESALESLDAAGDLSGNAEALTLRGRARLLEGDLDGATDDLDAALALEPELESAIVARAKVDLAEGDPRAAVGRLEDLYDDGADGELAIAYASALRRIGERERADSILDDHLDGPFAGRAHLEVARLARDRGEFRDARGAYAKAIELMDDATEARLEAAILALDTGDATGAREALDALVEDRPEHGRVLVQAARMHTLTGDAEGADELLKRAEKIDSAPRWLIARERGRSALRRGLPKAAVAELERAVSLRSDDGETRLLLIAAHLGADDGAAARRTLTDILKRFAGRPEKQIALGRVDLYFDRLGDALAAFEKARELHRKNDAPARHLAEADYWIGRVYYYDNKLRRARRFLERAVERFPVHIDAWFFLGLVDLERKRYPAAAKAFGEAVDVDPTALPSSWFYLGRAAFEVRRFEIARKGLKKYLELVPNGAMSDDARKLLRRMN